MKAFFEKVVPRIWTRLFILTLAAVVVTWVVTGFSVQALRYARNVVTELETDQVPTLTKTSRLSVQVADLAVLSNELLFANSLSGSPLRVATGDLSSFLSDNLAGNAIQAETRDIVDQLDLITRMLVRTQRIEAETVSDVTRLRWLNVEIQEETAALAADFNYNIQAQTRALVDDDTQSSRETRAQYLVEEMRLRESFAELGAASTTAFSVAVQSVNSRSPAQLDQFAEIEADAFSRIRSVLRQLPEKSEYLTLRQSVDALDTVINGRDGLISKRRAWHETRGSMHAQLETALSDLTGLQERLQQDAEAQRDHLTTSTAAFADRIERTMLLMMIATVMALAAGLAILFLYIRPVIIRPMQSLTNAMHQIAGGATVDPGLGAGRKDEIGQLARAVHAFSASVRERDRAIAELKQTQNELVQAGKMAALGSLSAGIGHELNQPLGAMHQRLHLMRRAAETDDAEAQVRQIEKMEALALRMERIITHLKRFARRSEYQRAEVALVPLIEGAHELMKTVFDDRGISVTIDPALQGEVFIGDPVLVEQVLVNLFSNASDAIAETGGTGEIGIRREQAAEGFIAFSVVDSGVGLGDLDPKRAFDPFITTKDPGSGLGLGLSISYNIMRGLGGNLSLSERKGAGARATVTLPTEDPST
ncbi:sensor histidine kinase [Oceanibium sediminis]|uniref:sensor histidine kinase n=1 Tax=Oceanibium sediminis TaxID=2026339 RepID=UPI000DD3D096|nr:ATP-binding protein [Oceanibium sediminis]